ncbi:response regulator transcription factor [Anoxybacillus sp. J5B_2022]|uniref:response regulator transcription factor n=1 Tax=Anoxybacillus sp. J5B_2022 TaxID=3003246 RepID=UPI0022863C61|nr:response regulator transcription factor [Anoxybacillus sp. J5B_2022]MCZ0754280.1 response regulator transcription factor [Anoxybacillus sp. J5B_2022]
MAKILLAEDEEVLRMLVFDTLEDEGYDIDEACDGQEAIELIKENDYDLILLDYMMPIYTGLEVIQQVRSIPEKKHVKIMMLSAKSQQADQQRVLEAGADYFMAKPYSPIELVKRIEEILHGEN